MLRTGAQVGLSPLFDFAPMFLDPEGIGRMSRWEDVREATRRMRKILGMSQKDYARKAAAIFPRILSQFEKGSGNPTLATLDKIASSFGLKVTSLPPKFWRMKEFC